MTRRRWIADTWQQQTATITGTNARHLSRVLRATPGQRFDLATGGQLWLAEITSATDEEVHFNLIEQLDRDRDLPLTLLIAIFKFDRLEWALEKATELGTQRIIPVIAQRTEKHLAQAAAARHTRWQRILTESAQQSRRTTVPQLDEPRTLKQALTTTPENTLALLLDENEKQLPLRQAIEATAHEHIQLALGPEGGWTDQERQLFTQANYQPVTLGPRILRAETAIISATAITSALLT